MSNKLESKKSLWLRLMPLIIGVVCFGLAIWFVLRERQTLIDVFSNIDVITITKLIIITILMIFLNGLSLKVFIKFFGINISILESFWISVSTSFGNYVAPLSAGFVARAAYLRKQHNLAYTDFITLTSASYLLILVYSSAVALIIIILTQYPLQFYQALVLPLVIVLGVSVSLVIVRFPSHLFSSIPIIGKQLEKILSGWSTLRTEYGILIKQSIIILLIFFVIGLLYYVSFQTTNYTIPLDVSILLGIVLALSLLFRITPGNIGLQELALGGIVTIVGISAETGVIIGLIIRSIQILVIFSFGPIGSVILARKIKSQDII